MVASTVQEAGEDVGGDLLIEENIGNEGFTTRHSIQMFKEGRSFSGNERNKVFFGRAGGGFADLSALSAADSPMDGRAVAACDLDDDGDVDLFVHNIQREQHLLLRNDIEASGRSLKVRLRATSSQYEAIGALVTVTTVGGACSQVLSRGAGFLSCQAPELVFGLGQGKAARLHVRWPGGALEDFGSFSGEAGRLLLVEGSGAPQPFDAHPAALPDPGPRGLKLSEGDRLPVLVLRDGDGKRAVLDVAALAAAASGSSANGGGAMTLVNFWGSRCAACVKELPDLARVAAGGEQRVVLVNTDPPAERERAERILARHGRGLPSFYIEPDIGAGEAGLADVVDLERLPLPTTLVVAPDGRVDTIMRGSLRAD